MSPTIASLTDRIQALETELEAELAKRRAELHVGLEKGRAHFEAELLRRHREMRTRLSTYIAHARPMVVLTALLAKAVAAPGMQSSAKPKTVVAAAPVPVVVAVVIKARPAAAAVPVPQEPVPARQRAARRHLAARAAVAEGGA